MGPGDGKGTLNHAEKQTLTGAKSDAGKGEPVEEEQRSSRAKKRGGRSNLKKKCPSPRSISSRSGLIISKRKCKDKAVGKEPGE